MTQLIRTKYHGPGNVRGSRISATTASGIRRYYPWGLFDDDDANHAEAADRLARELGWRGQWFGGHDKTGMVFVQAGPSSPFFTR